MAKLKVHVDAEGRLVLPPEAAEAYGLKPGAQAFIDTGENRLILKAPASHPAKLYIEPTNACNLECRTCIRNDWQETAAISRRETRKTVSEIPIPPAEDARGRRHRSLPLTGKGGREMYLEGWTKEVFRAKCNPQFQSVHCLAHLDNDITKRSGKKHIGFL